MSSTSSCQSSSLAAIFPNSAQTATTASTISAGTTNNCTMNPADGGSTGGNAGGCRSSCSAGFISSRSTDIGDPERDEGSGCEDSAKSGPHPDSPRGHTPSRSLLALDQSSSDNFPEYRS